MIKLNTSILTVLALSGALFVCGAEGGGMSMGSQNGPNSAYGPGPGGDDSGFGMGNRPGRGYGYGQGPGYGPGPGGDNSGSGFGMGNRP